MLGPWTLTWSVYPPMICPMQAPFCTVLQPSKKNGWDRRINPGQRESGWPGRPPVLELRSRWAAEMGLKHLCIGSKETVLYSQIGDQETDTPLNRNLWGQLLWEGPSAGHPFFEARHDLGCTVAYSAFIWCPLTHLYCHTHLDTLSHTCFHTTTHLHNHSFVLTLTLEHSHVQTHMLSYYHTQGNIHITQHSHTNTTAHTHIHSLSYTFIYSHSLILTH